MKYPILFFAAVAALLCLLVLTQAIYTVEETEQVIITQFGKPQGDPIDEAGLHFKLPFIQKANSIEKRVLAWDGTANEMPTKDKLFILADTFARWRISDPSRYFIRLHDERSAKSRLDDILGSETRTAVANHDLIEIIRTTNDIIEVTRARESAPDDGSFPTVVAKIDTVTKGRTVIENEIAEKATDKLAEFGIELLDVRFKRINYYDRDVQERIFERMISERQQIAERFRSEGAGEASRIDGDREREIHQIESQAYKTIQEIEGEADARAAEIYANAYSGNDAVAFYEFIKSMDTYKAILSKDSTMILSTDSDLFQYLKGMDGDISKTSASEQTPNSAPAETPRPDPAPEETPRPSPPPIAPEGSTFSLE